MSESIQNVIPMLHVQCVKSPGGHCLVRVNVRYHLLDIPYHTLLVGQDGSASFALVVAQYCEKSRTYQLVYSQYGATTNAKLADPS